MMTMTESWMCPTCGSTVSTPYCPSCGEHPLRERELTLRGLFDQLVQVFTNIDGRLIRSFRCLICRPGFLTIAYLQGRRKPYVGPVRLFLIANVLFFTIESLTGGTVFSTPLDSHLHAQPWSPLAASLVPHRLAAMRTTLDSYAPVFDHAVALNARLFIIFMALSFAPVASIVFHRNRRPLAVHALFAFHLYAFMLLLFCVATVIPPIDRWFGGGRARIRMAGLHAVHRPAARVRRISLHRDRSRVRCDGDQSNRSDPHAHRWRRERRAGLPICPVADHAVQHLM